MNRKHKASRVWNFNTEMFITLTKVQNIAKTTIKFI